MVKIINFSTFLLLVLLVSTGLLEKGEGQGCEWECVNLPNFKCWLGEAGHKLCDDFCKSEGGVRGVCVSNPHRCICRRASCS
ncbi:unnamed protein product [Cochlearia groenlandica]